MVHDFFKSSFFLSAVIEWNKLEKNIQKTESLTFSKKTFKNLLFIPPFQISVYNCHNPKGVKLLKKSRLGLGHFRQHKFKHRFQDTLNPIRNCCNDIETSSHYLLRNPNYFEKNI